MAADDLIASLEQQAEVNRSASKEVDTAALGVYANISQTAENGTSYVQMGDASVPQGTGLAANYDPTTGEVIWVETYQAGESGSQLSPEIKCANGTDCLDSDFCYGWYECDECDWCEGNRCEPRNPARPCNATWECPCPPNEGQHYDCVDSTCKLTCAVNSDCGECEVCDLIEGYCGPGCESDFQCNPLAAGSVGDAQPNTFCLDCECVFPCDPVRFCSVDTDCREDEYCGDREYRVASDPQGAIYQCVPGCRSDSSCEEGETCDVEDRNCYKACASDADCPDGEGCNDDGKCSQEGALCCGHSDCGADEYCNQDGRCASGCATDSQCGVECGPDPTCADACPPEPTCTCEGEGCFDENWRDLCNRDPACLALCPDEPACVRDQGKVCVDNRCERVCSDSAQCLEDEICKEGVCMLRETTASEPADPRLGCAEGETCNQYGTCEPVICQTDEQCPSGALCQLGICVEGCSDTNPCPNGGCCKGDGTCGKSCTSDYQCADEPGNQLCLEGGCCGLICEPLIPCVSFSDCEAGQYCAEEGYCLDGCKQDTDCEPLEGRHRCQKQYVKAPNGALAPCERYPNEECFSEIGQCEQYCLSAADCVEGEVCVDEQCQSPDTPESNGEPCGNDNDCYTDASCADGCSTGVTCLEAAYNGQICKSNVCTTGCRTDSQCKTGEVCRANECKYSCTSTEVCIPLMGDSATCQDGVCVVLNEGSAGEGGRKGCECWEFCDKDGTCTAYECDSDLDCEEEACGSCLANHTCGPCFFDGDCPGTKVCDIPEGATEGTCAYACNPAGPGTCLGNIDCPAGFYCVAGQCERGCAVNDDCLPGTVCRGEQCVSACTIDGQCGMEHRCVEGGCRYVGEPCDPENNYALETQKQIDAQQQRIDAQEQKIDEQQKLIDQNREQQDELLAANEPVPESLILQAGNLEQQAESLAQGAVLLEQQMVVLQYQLETDQNRDCPSGKVCNGDQCEYPLPECLANFECTYPATCVDGACVDPPNAEDYRSFDPAVIGCESCAEFCVQGKCEEITCERDDDCPCGFCGGGRCIEECQSDLACGGRVCEQGACVDCRTNGDCTAEFGFDAVCDGGECRTPCGKSFSTGSCGEGLNYGDTCEYCPDRCPGDSRCQKTNETCSLQEVYDPITRQTRVKITACQQCVHSCITSSDCEDGYVCNGYGVCVKSSGRCTYDSDCAEESLSSGVTMKCRNATCIEPGETCFTQSDCDPGEVCDGGNCITGNCGDNNPCQTGKTCVDNTCGWSCGSEYTPIVCGQGSPTCPPGMTCQTSTAYGGYCMRPGITLSTVEEPSCPVGTMCCGGGCVPIDQNGRQCCEDSHCSGDAKCCDGKCMSECPKDPAQADPTEASDSKEEQDPCKQQGKCCQDDGFCGPCACDEKNPCSGGKCCDRDSGTCISYGQHPQTRFGAPDACDYAPVYCEILGPPTGEDASRSTIDPYDLAGPTYKGCEVIDPARRLLKCWEGAAMTDTQIRRQLEIACFRKKKKECRCDDIPAQDECVTDEDCGACGQCETKTFTSDACCGVYGEGEYETSYGYEEAGLDFIERNVCVNKNQDGEDNRTAEDCGCRSDEDCTECEVCDGGGVQSLGYCRPACDERCPCGGDLSRGKKCKTCEERWGKCAKEESFEITPPRIDLETGEEIPAETGCACVLDRSKECCKGHDDLNSLYASKYKCLENNIIYPDGTLEWVNTEKCIDPDNDKCAQCETDAQCPGSQTCESYVCVSKCGKEDSDPDSKTKDSQDKGGIGGDPYSCYCCSEKGDCHPAFTSWIESDGIMYGPWNISYKTYDEQLKTFYSSEKQLADALATLVQILGYKPRVQTTIGETPSGKCRPCSCETDGIQCGAWAECAGCYKWVEVGTSETENNYTLQKAEILKQETGVAEAEEESSNCEDELLTTTEELTLADANYVAAWNYFQSSTNADERELYDLEVERKTLEEALRESESDQSAVNNGINQLNNDLAQAEANGLVEAMQLIATDLTNAEAEWTAIEDQQRIWRQRLVELDELITDLKEELQLSASQEVTILENTYQVFLVKRQAYWDKINECEDIEGELAKARYDLALTEHPQNTYFKQVRACDCCVDGVCREDSDCTYGTCYLCVNEYSGEYRAALHGKVLEQLISPSTPLPENFDKKWAPKITGKTIWKYELEVDQCVMFPCGSGWYSEERPGTIQNIRYYEYCTGSILGCVLSYPFDRFKYLHGWKYNVRLDDAGNYYTSDFVHWTKLGKWEGSGVRSSQCLYWNQLGGIGGSDLGTFYDLVATHPICNYAELWLECPPEYPNCQILLGSYYQSGATDSIIKRLRREIKEWEAYLNALESVINEILDYYDVKSDEKDDLENQLEELIQQYNDERAYLQSLTNTVSELGAELETANEAKDDQNELIQQREELLSEASSELQEAIGTRQDLEQQVEEAEYLKGVAEENLDSARARANQLYLQANRIRAELQALRNQLAALTPGTVEYDLKQNEITNKENELQTVEEERASVTSDAIAYGEEVESLTTLLDTNSCSEEEPCRGLYALLGSARSVEVNKRYLYQQRYQDLAAAREGLANIAADISAMSNQLIAKNKELETQQEYVDFLADEVGKEEYDPDLCPDGSEVFEFRDGTEVVSRVCCPADAQKCTQSMPSPGGMKRQCGRICSKIDAIKEVLVNLLQSKAELEAEKVIASEEIDTRESEIDRLLDADQTPDYLTGPVAKPGSVATAADLKKQAQENGLVDFYLDKLSEEERYYIPGGTSQA